MNTNEILIRICQNVEEASQALRKDGKIPIFSSCIHDLKDEQYQLLIKTWAEQIQQESQLRSSKLPETDRKLITEDRKKVFQYIAELFVALEDNGDVNMERDKLSYLFPTASAALQWLPYYTKAYVEQNRGDQPIHELCLHIEINEGQVPMPPYRQIGEGNLKKLFENGRNLRLFTQGIHYIEKVEPSGSLSEWLKHIEEELDNKELRDLGFDLEALSKEDRATLDQIFKINERFKCPKYEHAKEMLETLKRAQNSDQNLPNISVTSESIGLPPGFYMAKLPDNDPRCAMAGKLTGCCQYIGGEGQDCATHAIESDLGATYAIFRGKVEGGKTQTDIANDRPVVMSWAWRNNDLVCFDSIEYDRVGRDSLEKMNESLADKEKMAAEEIIERLYFSFSNSMIKTDNTIAQVNVGTGGGTPKMMGSYPITFPELKKLNHGPLNYKSYRDSKKQRTLTSRDHPGLYKVSAREPEPLWYREDVEERRVYQHFIVAIEELYDAYSGSGYGSEKSYNRVASMTHAIEAIDNLLQDPLFAARALGKLVQLDVELLEFLCDKVASLEKGIFALEVLSGERAALKNNNAAKLMAARYAHDIDPYRMYTRDYGLGNPKTAEEKARGEILELFKKIDSKESAAWFINGLGLPKETEVARKVTNLIPYNELETLIVDEEDLNRMRKLHINNPYHRYERAYNASTLPPIKRMQAVCVGAMDQLVEHFDEAYPSIQQASREDILNAIVFFSENKSKPWDMLKDTVFRLILNLELASREENAGPLLYAYLSNMLREIDEEHRQRIIERSIETNGFDATAAVQLIDFLKETCEKVYENLTQEADHTISAVKALLMPQLDMLAASIAGEDEAAEKAEAMLGFLIHMSQEELEEAMNNSIESGDIGLSQVIRVLVLCEKLQAKPNEPDNHIKLGEALQAAQKALENANDKTSVEVKGALERAIERLNVPPPPKMGSTH